MSKVWFITGTSKGFGRIWAEAALERGDRVAATARDAATLQPTSSTRYGDAVLPIALDVTDKAAVDAAVGAGARRTSAASTWSSTTPATACSARSRRSARQQARAQIETNLFGALWVTKAALPYLREQGSRPHHPGVVDRRRQRLPDARPLPRLQVGPRGLQPGAGRRGRGLRDQGHDRRADRLRDRLARPVLGRRPTHARRPTTASARARDASVRRAPLGRRATRRPPARRSSSSSTPTSRRCACSSATARST